MTAAINVEAAGEVRPDEKVTVNGITEYPLCKYF